MKRIMSSLLMGATMLAIGAPALAKSIPNVTCMQTAIAVRETAIQKAFATYMQTVSDAYSKRATGLAAAWALTDTNARKQGIKSAWVSFRNTKQTAKKMYVKSRNALWITFKGAAKACHMETGEDTGSESLDLQP